MILSKYAGEEGIDKLADILEPAIEIMTDKDVMGEFDKNRVRAVKNALKNHKRAVIEIMAVLNDKDPATYQPTMFELPRMLINAFNDPDVRSLFQLQGQTMANASSGSAMGNTGESGQ